MVGIASAGGRCRSLGPGAWNEATPRFRSKWRWPFLMSSARTSTSWHVNGRKNGFKSSKVAWQIWATIKANSYPNRGHKYICRDSARRRLWIYRILQRRMDLNQTATMKFSENKWLSLHFYVAILLILKHASVTSGHIRLMALRRLVDLQTAWGPFKRRKKRWIYRIPSIPSIPSKNGDVRNKNKASGKM